MKPGGAGGNKGGGGNKLSVTGADSFLGLPVFTVVLLAAGVALLTVSRTRSTAATKRNGG